MFDQFQKSPGIGPGKNGARVTAGLSVILSAVFVCCAAAGAGDSFDKSVKQEAAASFLAVPLTDVESQSGRVGITKSGMEYSCEWWARETLPLKFSVGTEYTGIDNTSPLELPARLAAAYFDFELTLPLFGVRDTYLRLGMTPSLLGDGWDYSTSDFRIPMRVLAAYKPDEVWLFAAGVAFFPEFERQVVPVFGLVYRPNDVWTVQLLAPRPQVKYRMTERLSVFGEAGFSGGEYEVEKGPLKSAVLQYKEVHAGLGMEYKLNDVLIGSVSAGGMFSRQLKYRDSLGKAVIDNAPYAALRLSARF